MGSPFQQLDIISQLVYLTPKQLIETRIIQTVYGYDFTGTVIRFRIEESQLFGI